MPQRASRQPLLTTLTQQATKALAALHKEITKREQELATLKAEAVRWQNVMRGPPGPGRTAGIVPAPPPPLRPMGKIVGPAVAPRVPLPKRPRLDWRAILKELPARFTTKDVAQKAGKPLGHVYVYVSRWMKDKKVRRVEEGYQKVS